MVRFFGRAMQWLGCVVIIGLAVQPAWAVTIEVQSDRNPVAMNESFRLIFEADGPVDGNPDFKALEQAFEILHQSQGTSMQLINGKVSQTRRWTLVLMPRQSGQLLVPSIPFGKDKSQPLMIAVTEAAEASAESDHSTLFIEVSAEPGTEAGTASGTAYVQSQVIYKVRLFRAINVANARLSEPVISDADAVIEKLGDEREFETTRNGRRYVVLERNYAIFPQQSGRVTIAAVTFEGQVVNRARGMFDVFDQGGPIRRVRSAEVTLEVEAVPASEDKQQWLPAREVQLIETWPDEVDLAQAVTAGEPLTWTLTLIADGLTAAQLPAVTPVMPEGLKAYPDQPKLLNDKKQHTLVGVRQEKIALIPTQAGEYLLPAIEIPWWNSISGKRETVRLPARTLRVTAPIGMAAAAESTAVEVTSMANGEETSITPQSGTVLDDSRWHTMSVVLGLGWLLTIIAWLLLSQSRRRVANERKRSGSERAAVDFSGAKKALQVACRSHDAAAAKEALLEWGRVRWPAAPPGSLGQLALWVGEPLRVEIMQLNRRLYSHSSSESQSQSLLDDAADGGWNGALMWQHFTHELSQQQRESAVKKDPILAPMYP